MAWYIGIPVNKPKGREVVQASQTRGLKDRYEVLIGPVEKRVAHWGAANPTLWVTAHDAEVGCGLRTTKGITCSHLRR